MKSSLGRDSALTTLESHDRIGQRTVDSSNQAAGAQLMPPFSAFGIVDDNSHSSSELGTKYY
jgi:hypothetical protein